MTCPRGGRFLLGYWQPHRSSEVRAAKRCSRFVDEEHLLWHQIAGVTAVHHAVELDVAHAESVRHPFPSPDQRLRAPAGQGKPRADGVDQNQHPRGVRSRSSPMRGRSSGFGANSAPASHVDAREYRVRECRIEIVTYSWFLPGACPFNSGIPVIARADPTGRPQ